jgi:GT2 family glycosyltransferase
MSVQKISFIIPLFNHLAETQAMLATLQATIPDGLAHEIILIDDGSTDGTRAWLQTVLGPHIKTLLNAVNVGFAKTNNTAAAVAAGNVLALLNNDLLLEPGWLAPMLHTLQSPALNAGLVGNIQHRVADGALDHAGVVLNASAQFVHVQTLADHAPAVTKVLSVTGACVLMRKADFDAVGGLDESFVNGCEDIDLCFKLRAAGKAIYVANDSRIRHHVSLSRKVNNHQNQRNSRTLFSKWRKEIKQELTSVWAKLLLADPQAYADQISGRLSPVFLSTPHTAARVLAEAMLHREEAQWSRDLGAKDSNADIATRCHFAGLRYSGGLQAYTMAPVAEVALHGVAFVSNFFVCGRLVGGAPRQDISITIAVNGIQRQTFRLANERNFNVGIVYPVQLVGATNVFRVTVNFVNDAGQPLGDASAELLVTHLVIDDKVVLEW